MEDEYLAAIKKHSDGTKGKRGVDTLCKMFATLVDATDRTRADILGDLFQGSITYGEKGQFLTPEPICTMMAAMQLPTKMTDLDGRRSVNDPCCGSGRMLLAAAEIQPNWHFVGQDVDLRCTRMTAINLALRNHYGHVVHGNSLRNTSELIYETGRIQIYGNAIRQVNQVPMPPRSADSVDAEASQAAGTDIPQETNGREDDDNRGTNSQLQLF